jgi:hypothetical protein
MLTYMATVSLIVCGFCGVATCQYAAEFSSYHGGNRYDFRLTQEQLAKTPVWLDDEANPPLSMRHAKFVGFSYLKQLIADGKFQSKFD